MNTRRGFFRTCVQAMCLAAAARYFPATLEPIQPVVVGMVLSCKMIIDGKEIDMGRGEITIGELSDAAFDRGQRLVFKGIPLDRGEARKQWERDS